MGENRLADASSPYLLQHADNPVHWQLWGEEALTEARENNKPVLLSIGYAACHWCHVMARESFSCEQTAEIMNRLFINIKVDKEERPDLDKIYQTAHALISQRSGGWPLTIFLEPRKQRPFFSGTYFPGEPRFGMPAFRDILRRVYSYYMQNQDDVQRYGEQLELQLKRIYAPGKRKKELSSRLLALALDDILDLYDRENGGFGDAPKFPGPGYLQILLHHALDETRNRGDQDNIEKTTSWQCLIHCLMAMGHGGLYDHLGGGYFRYAVDAQWSTPHFEKMLYDNGQLLSLMADTQAIRKNFWLREKIRETVEWLRREMRTPGGAFYSSLDADAEGVEGQFYLWDREEVKSLLSAEDERAAAAHFGLDQPANCEGKWNLRCRYAMRPPTEKAAETNPPPQEQMKKIKRQMWQAREQRVHPQRDDKVISGWNGLAIKGLARAAIAEGEQSYYQLGKEALACIRRHCWLNNALHTAGLEGGQQWQNGYLDDYACLIEAILHLLQCQWCDDDLHFALQLADAALEKFEDKDNGGYFFTDSSQEQPLQRPRLLHDESLPSGYGVLALSLHYLGLLCGREDYLDSASEALASSAEALERSPHNCSHLLMLHEETRNPSPLLIIRGAGDEGRAWLRSAQARRGKKLCFLIPAEADLPGPLAGKKATGQTTAYLCRGTGCSPAINSFQDLERQFK